MALFFLGEPVLGGADPDFILPRASATMAGGAGDDLILGDAGYVANGHGLALDDAFDLDANPDAWTAAENALLADDVVPHRLAYVAPGAGETAWYCFEASAGAVVTIDADSWGGIGAADQPLEIRLVDAGGAVLATALGGVANQGGLGSRTALDAFLQVAVPAAGLWYVQVLEADTGDGGLFDGDEAFVLGLSVSGHAVGGDPFAAGADSMAGDAGDDLLIGGAGADTLDGGAGADVLSGGTGNDLLLVSDQFDRLDGGAGIDMASWIGAESGMVVDAASGLYAGIEIFALSLFDDTFAGSQAGEEIRAQGGSDVIAGGGGNDRIVLAGGGSHTVDGGTGHDSIDGDGVGDTLSGSTGNDTVRGGDGADMIQGGGGNDVLTGGGGADDVFAHGNNDSVDGGGGNDTLRGGLGLDTLAGGEDDDWLQGDAGADVLLGGNGADSLFGGNQADVLDGGHGDDVVQGGLGRDVHTGGNGADRFVWNLNDFGTNLRAGADRITDFGQGQGDLIDLSAIDASPATAGNNAFAWIGSAAFTGAAGQLRYAHEGGNTWVEGDRNGDGQADFAIRLDGLIALSAGDFVL